MTGFANKYRPRKLAQVVGQSQCVGAIQQALKRKAVPQACLFCGPPGTGKTTQARILAGLVGATGSDVVEINCADKRTLDDIRGLLQRVSQLPFESASSSRAYILDEAHQLTKKQGGDAQTALLKRLEEPPTWDGGGVYFFLCSSEPQHLLPAIRSRCTTYKTIAIPLDEQKKLIRRVAEKEKLTLSDLVVARIVEVAQGSGRDALKLLDQVAGMTSEEDQLDLLSKSDAQTESIQLCRLLSNPWAKWDEVSDCLKNLEGEPEEVRRRILGYFGFVALSGGKSLQRAIYILSVFRDNYFDCGKAGLIADCYEVVHAGKKK